MGLNENLPPLLRKEKIGKIQPFLKDKGLFIFLSILILYVIIFTAIAVWRYDNFLYIESGDLTIFEQVIYNTLHGRPFYSTFDWGNHFGAHNSPILILLVPFAIIIPVPYVLYASTVFSIAVSAIPIYLIAREELKDEKISLFLGLCYIMLPTLIGQAYLSFHEINLVLPFLTFAFYFFVKERFIPFMVMFSLGLTVKEDVALTLFMFSIYAFIKKRDKKWYLAPAILSIAWFLLSIKVIIPFFNKSHSYPMISYLSDLGGSFTEIIINILSDPQSTFKKLLQLDRLFYLLTLFSPVGFILPFFSSAIIFVIPSLFINMIAESMRFRLHLFDTSMGLLLLPWHMSLMPAVFLFISTIYSVKKVSLIYPRYGKAVAITLLISGIFYNDRFIASSTFYERSPSQVSADSIKSVLAQIPIQATVKAPRDIATHLYDRKEVYFFEHNVDADYLVLKVLKGNFYDYEMLTRKPPIDESIRERYDIVILRKDIALLKKKL